MSDITAAKRLIAAKSPKAARLLGLGIVRPVAQVRYNSAAAVALADPEAGFSPNERALIASFIRGEDGEATETRSELFAMRMAPSEMEDLRQRAEAAGVSLSDYVRQRVFE